MKLVKFRVKHYKSIDDSGDCYFSDKLTILAGKNESGKTSILEALEDFHESKTIRQSAKQINGSEKPEVMVTFDLTIDDLNEIYQGAGIDIVATKAVQITLVKEQGTEGYTLPLETSRSIGLEPLFGKAYNELKRLRTTAPKPQYGSQGFTSYVTEVRAFRETLTEATDIEQVDKVLGFVEDYKKRAVDTNKFIDTFVENKMPYFILFSSFDDNFPDEIALEELDASEWASDLESVSTFNKKAIADIDKQNQANHQNGVNAEFTDKFNKYWTQDTICLEVQKNETINFWIKEDGVLHRPSQRSQGQQWYLSFYIKVVARMSEGKPNVILIDEPGLFLHARAQKDLLNVLNHHTSNYPIVFSTHSPYLITEDNLENVRLVEKKQRKTTVLGKIHAHETADKETLTPILTAIGLGVNDSITNLDQKDNVVVEGPEDVFYLQAFKQLLPEASRPKVNFINGGGAGNMGKVGAILEGWGANIWYLFDNDQGFKDGSGELGRAWKVLPESIKKVLGDDEGTIADLISLPDFKKFVLENEAAKYTSKNSAYIKKSKLEKVLLARQFLQRVKGGNVSIDATTKDKIEKLFEEIKFK